MPVERTSIDGLFVVRWETHSDGRGFFRQTHQAGELEDMLGRTLTLRQGNHSRSVPGALRGFHAEPWEKLVYVARGTAMAAVADVRPESATFGEVETFHLGDPPGERVRLFIAEGLANAYCAYGDEPTDYLYDVSEEWFSTEKRAVAWNDPDLNVNWPVRSPILSPEDESNPTLRERFPSHPRFANMTPSSSTRGRALPSPADASRPHGGSR
jgi:dTDP-4-dehydrorhamnose 3,5-epimerase